MYYLQSRYYDPEIGRFINADEFVSTGQDFLGYNMFAYCNNNPIIFIDHAGKDAVVLLDKDGVGHVGIMAQDDDGLWWHFYWGTMGGKRGIARRILCFFSISVEPYTWCVPFDGEATSLTEINNSNQYGGNYESIYYFTGDFSSAVNEMQNQSKKYNLYSNNCSQVSLGILAQANDEYKEIFTNAAKKVIPVIAYNQITRGASGYSQNENRYYGSGGRMYNVAR